MALFMAKRTCRWIRVCGILLFQTIDLHILGGVSYRVALFGNRPVFYQIYIGWFDLNFSRDRACPIVKMTRIISRDDIGYEEFNA